MQRLVIHIEEGLREVIDLDDVYYLEADEHDTLVRLAGKRNGPQFSDSAISVFCP